MKIVRIPIDLNSDDQEIRINLEDEFQSLDVLSLNITSNDVYSRVKSDFGVIVGRVTTSQGLGIQNAKINIFIPLTEEDKSRIEITQLYPFESINDTYPNGVRYNLFPRVRNKMNISHKAIGNFPVLDDFSHYPQYVEIMDKYYKYTVTTNESGDYMIFGVPVGQHTIIMDFDIFDTNSFEVTANDLVQQIKINSNLEDNEELIESSGFVNIGNNNYDVDIKINIDEMPNIFHEVKTINVSPFWGDSMYDIGITRADFSINYKYIPTAIFFGSIHSASAGFGISSDYKYTNKTQPEISGDIYPCSKIDIVVYRLDDDLTPGSRKRLGVFQGDYNRGTFQISLPMYFDYYITNELGELVPTKDTELGVPTKGTYAFEFYETDDSWGGRRVPWGGYINSILPGVRVPCSNNGDVWCGGWEGTWGGLFEYDIINRKRKFYTIQTTYRKHSLNNILISGDYIGYFPKFNEEHKDASWNYPLHYDDVADIDFPTIIGSVLIPRIYTEGSKNEFNEITFKRASNIVYEPWKDKSETYNEWVNDFEFYLGLGTQYDNGYNKGNVFIDLFKATEFMDENGNNFFGDALTWNWGDNSDVIFTTSLYASEKSTSEESKANEFSVHPAFNQTTDATFSYGVFINSVNFNEKQGIMDILIYDITDELPDLISNKVYSSYKKGDIIPNTIISRRSKGKNIKDISINNISTSDENDVKHPNAYNGKFYYFGLWGDTNSLYNIEKSYFIK